MIISNSRRGVNTQRQKPGKGFSAGHRNGSSGRSAGGPRGSAQDPPERRKPTPRIRSFHSGGTQGKQKGIGKTGLPPVVPSRRHTGAGIRTLLRGKPDRHNLFGALTRTSEGRFAAPFPGQARPKGTKQDMTRCGDRTAGSDPRQFRPCAIFIPDSS